MDKFHNQVLRHLIYAILWEDDGDELVFVGKTTTSDTKAVLRRHLRGEISVTANDLKCTDWEGKPPRLIVLHALECTGAEAYRYILCYHRLYEDFGYMTVSYRGIDDQAYDMLPDTKCLYEELQRTVTREFLSVGIVVEKPKIESVSMQQKEMTTQLNIRLEMHSLCRFRQFCDRLNITQKEGFLHLLHCVCDDTLDIDPIFIELKKKNERQERQIKELEAKLRTQSRGQKADERLKNAVSNMKQFVAQYIELAVCKPLESQAKKQSRARCAVPKEYQYPESSGEMILQLHSWHYGHGTYPAIFMCGEDTQTKRKIKLRYYPKRTFLGCSPKSEYFAPKTDWFVSFQVTKGVAELGAALPLPIYDKTENSQMQNQSRSSIEVESLENQILAAEQIRVW